MQTSESESTCECKFLFLLTVVQKYHGVIGPRQTYLAKNSVRVTNEQTYIISVTLQTTLVQVHSFWSNVLSFPEQLKERRKQPTPIAV